jgi:hypothetical protein
MSQRIILLAIVGWASVAAAAAGRQWTDSTAKYGVDASLIAFDDEKAVLKRENHELVAVPLARLSKEDREYLKSQEAAEQVRRAAEQMQTWITQSGIKVVGRVVDFGRKDVTIQRRRGRLYVNDRLFDNLPQVYREMLPKIVAHFEKIAVDGRSGLQSWVLRQRGVARTFTCEGVMLELENGDEYGIPFFLFSEEDRKILQPGWERWLAAEKSADKRSERERQSFLLQSAAQAYQQDRLANQQIALLQLDLLAAASGLVDLWEVRLFPRPGVLSPPLSVVVPARDSRAATQEALLRNPGFIVGPVRRVARR